jgi:predicted nucleic-acid-binding protein
MIALDTNVLVRLTVGDDPGQLALAERLLRLAAESREPCFVSDPVLCELEWVLESSYGAGRADVLAVMEDLAAREIFEFEDREALRRAIAAYQGSRADFSDCLIGARAAARGARTTYTFDRDLGRLPGFSVLGR